MGQKTSVDSEEMTMSEEEVKEFLRSDLGFMQEAFEKEKQIALAMDAPDEIKKAYLGGLNMGFGIGKEYYETRIEEGF